MSDGIVMRYAHTHFTMGRIFPTEIVPSPGAGDTGRVPI